MSQIDALRGAAVLGVLAFHAFPGLVPLGYLGVDVFFAVSGFVIGRTYLRALASREVTWGTFWLKRARRLLPAYLVCLLVTASLAPLVLDPHLLVSFGESLLLQPLYLQNIHFWIEGDYFDAATTKPLLHTWSLAIEEQFYLLFFLPVLLLRVVRRPPLYLALLLGAAAASLGAMIAIESFSPRSAFYLLPFRAWQFLAGIAAYVAADLLLDARGRTSTTLSNAARAAAPPLLALLAFLLLRPGGTSDVGWHYPLAVTGVTAALLLLYELSSSASGGTSAPARTRPLVRSLAWPLEATGRISYSLYLWHWPLISLSVVHLGRPLNASEAIACLVLSYALAILSWRWIERPGRAFAPRADRRVLGQGIAGYALVLVAGFVLIGTGGALFRYPEPVRTWLHVSQERSPYRCGYVKRVLDPDGELCAVNAANGETGLLILGDSHADQLDEMIAQLGEERDVRVFLTTRNCDLDRYFSVDSCGESVVATLLEDIERHGIDTVLSISSWAYELSPESDFSRGIAPFVDDGLRVIVARTTPLGDWFNPRLRAERALSGEPYPPRFDARDLERQNREFDHALAASLERYPEQVSVLDAGDTICRGESSCDWLEGDAPLYTDGSHLSSYGIARVESAYRELFERELR